MRLWVLLLVEVAAFCGTASAFVAGAHLYHAHHLGQPGPLSGPAARPGGPVQQAISAGTDAADALRPPANLPIAEVAQGTFLGMSDEILLERMRKAEVKSLKFNRGGSSVSFRAEFKDGTRAAFKPNQTNPQSTPRKEVAAFRISRLLGLNLIPPSVMRALPKDDVLLKLAPESAAMRPRVEAETIFENNEVRGVLSYWIPTVMNMGLDSSDGIQKWVEWLTVGQPIPPDKVAVMAELSTLLLFDLIQNNSDRFSGGNLLGSPDGRTLFYMDNAFGFQTDAEGHARCRSYLGRAQKFSRRFVRALRTLDKQAIQRALAAEPGPPLLSEAEIDAVLGRRDQALRYVDDLRQKHGEDAVLVFP